MNDIIRRASNDCGIFMIFAMFMLLITGDMVRKEEQDSNEG